MPRITLIVLLLTVLAMSGVDFVSAILRHRELGKLLESFNNSATNSRQDRESIGHLERSAEEAKDAAWYEGVQIGVLLVACWIAVVRVTAKAPRQNHEKAK